MFLELGIFISQFIWLWRVRHVRRAAKKAGKSYDDYVAENPSKKLERSESTDTVDIEAGQGEEKKSVPFFAPLEKCVIKPETSTTEVVASIDEKNDMHEYPKKTAKPAGQVLVSQNDDTSEQ
jgi:hypothetical protein